MRTKMLAVCAVASVAAAIAAVAMLSPLESAGKVEEPPIFSASVSSGALDDARPPFVKAPPPVATTRAERAAVRWVNRKLAAGFGDGGHVEVLRCSRFRRFICFVRVHGEHKTWTVSIFGARSGTGYRFWLPRA